MARQLNYRLSNPGYTIYHRAALGGLAATVLAWGRKSPDGIDAQVTSDSVRISWGDDRTDQEALLSILAASFRLTEEKMIDLPGQKISADKEGLRLAIHNGIVGTFLQHPKMRPGEKEPRKFELRSVDDETGEIFTYKALNGYAHQKAQRTGLLNEKLKGGFPTVAAIPQWAVPGATGGALDIEGSSEDVILLLYLQVGCSVFLLRPRSFKEKAQYCIVVPDVVDLLKFARALHRIASAGSGIKRFSDSFKGRVVGGAEEAALRFLIDLQAEEVSRQPSVTGCLAVGMGKVAWDGNQINRSMIVKLKGDYPEMDVFRAANQYLGLSKVLKSKKGDSYVIPGSPIPELVAANLAAERHWCSQFVTLAGDQKDFDRMRFMLGGLKRMKEAVKDQDDQAIIRAFQEAWRLTMAALYRRANRDRLNGDRLVEVERERMRNAILRAKNSDLLTSWFMRFCAEATRGGPSKALANDLRAIRTFIFNPRNFERFQNLCLFSLVSYGSGEAKHSKEGTN